MIFSILENIWFVGEMLIGAYILIGVPVMVLSFIAYTLTRLIMGR